jgi:UDP-2,3-diacylglucosamine hydrolase
MAEFDGVLFSDLHLSEETPRLNALFDAFVQRVTGTPEIACLGDLTEYWVGYKHLRSSFGARLFEQMASLAVGARRAVWVGGNRDFMFTPQARAAGFETPRDLYFGEFCGRTVALEHGDRFCTLDRGYQRFRWWFRRMPWPLVHALATPSALHWGARVLRGRSKGETARKNPEVYGIQSTPVERLVARGADVIVCGHVHTPFARDYTAGGHTGRMMVMSDWREDSAVICTAKDGEFRLMVFDGDTFTPFDAPAEQRLYSAQI